MALKFKIGQLVYLIWPLDKTMRGDSYTEFILNNEYELGRVIKIDNFLFEYYEIKFLDPEIDRLVPTVIIKDPKYEDDTIKTVSKRVTFEAEVLVAATPWDILKHRAGAHPEPKGKVWRRQRQQMKNSKQDI